MKYRQVVQSVLQYAFVLYSTTDCSVFCIAGVRETVSEKSLVDLALTTQHSIIR